MVVLSNPGTYGTRKCSSWSADIHKSKDPEYKHPEIQKSKTFCHLWNLAIIFGFLGFWIFCVLHLCFQSVETAPKLDSEKNGVCIGIYSVSKGCACRGGGDHIYTYVYIYILIICTRVYVYM